MIFALVGYALTRGQRDFSSVTAVVATKYEVLVEHKSAAQARELLAKLPGGRPDPFAPRLRRREGTASSQETDSLDPRTTSTNSAVAKTECSTVL